MPHCSRDDPSTIEGWSTDPWCVYFACVAADTDALGLVSLSVDLCLSSDSCRDAPRDLFLCLSAEHCLPERLLSLELGKSSTAGLASRRPLFSLVLQHWLHTTARAPFTLAIRHTLVFELPHSAHSVFFSSVRDSVTLPVHVADC